MKALKITVVVLAGVIIFLLIQVWTLNNRLKETESALIETQASYERCMDNNEVLQSLYQVVLNKCFRMERIIRKYEPEYTIAPL